MNLQYFIFDLDNTLYAKKTGMLKYIDKRIDNFMKKKLNLPLEKVTELRVEYWRKYGTTLGGMIRQHQTDPQEYIENVYSINIKDFIRPDPRLQVMLSKINYRKVIFSNSPVEYIGEVLKVLGVAEFFEKIYDIRFCNYIGKPNLASYQQVLGDLKVNPEKCLFIDDALVNVQAAQTVGMETVWLTTEPSIKQCRWWSREIYQLPEIITKLSLKQFAVADLPFSSRISIELLN